MESICGSSELLSLSLFFAFSLFLSLSFSALSSLSSLCCLSSLCSLALCFRCLSLCSLALSASSLSFSPSLSLSLLSLSLEVKLIQGCKDLDHPLAVARLLGHEFREFRSMSLPKALAELEAIHGKAYKNYTEDHTKLFLTVQNKALPYSTSKHWYPE